MFVAWDITQIHNSCLHNYFTLKKMVEARDSEKNDSKKNVNKYNCYKLCQNLQLDLVDFCVNYCVCKLLCIRAKLHN